LHRHSIRARVGGDVLPNEVGAANNIIVKKENEVAPRRGDSSVPGATLPAVRLAEHPQSAL
jgi:hypothetical protein